MGIYDYTGSVLPKAYGVDGVTLMQAYDINGNGLIDGEQEETYDWDGMSEQFKALIDACILYCDQYVETHYNSFAFPVFTDVHTEFDWNEPHYISYMRNDLFAIFPFLGDMVNTYNDAELNNAVTYINKSTNQTKLLAIGNHEFGGYAEGDTLPKVWYKPLIANGAVFFADDGLTYYYDDSVNNIRYIVMDSNSTVKKQSGTQKFNMDALNWLASVLESSAGKDIIVVNHTMGSGFYLVTDTEQANWQSDTSITNMTTFNSIINAFVNKTNVNVTVDGVTNGYDFSNVSGDFIAYITGHYHNAGYYNAGYNKFTCPAILRNKTKNGMSFFIIDKDLRKIIFLVIRYMNVDYEVYEYTY